MFKTDRSLINAQFEGYKLDPLEQDDHVSTVKLPRKVSQARVSASTRSPSHLAFEEVRSRIRHNHLTMGKGGKALYFDEELGVNLIGVRGKQAMITGIYELPGSIHTEATSLQREYPTALSLTETVWFVADGVGRAYTIQEDEDGTAQILASFELILDDDTEGCPFTLCAASVQSNSATVILSAKFLPAGSKVPRYRLHGVEVSLGTSSSDELSPLRISWSLQARDLPLHTEFSLKHNAFLVLASERYTRLDDNTTETSQGQPSPDEMAPIPRAGESLDRPPLDQPPAPYSWTQSSDSVMIAFPLPSKMTTKDINVQFARKALTVLVKPSPSSDESFFITPPRYALKELWGEISASESLWTWDREDNHSYGLLTLHLEKGHDGTRWPQVFVSDKVEVMETLDPSELVNIRDLMEKYTVALGADGDDMGLGRGVPSLAEGEMDDEVDSNVGRQVVATWVKPDGTLIGGAMDAMPIDVLSTPLPSSSLLHGESQPSVVLKRTVDGLLFSPLASDMSDEDAAPQWLHTGTFSALAFVLASKRDTRFTFHVANRAAIAFESGGSGNIYIYRATTKVADKWAKQAILKISGGSAGNLLGAGVILLGGSSNETAVLCLCENELKVLKGVL